MYLSIFFCVFSKWIFFTPQPTLFNIIYWFKDILTRRFICFFLLCTVLFRVTGREKRRLVILLHGDNIARHVTKNAPRLLRILCTLKIRINGRHGSYTKGTFERKRFSWKCWIIKKFKVKILLTRCGLWSRVIC